MQSPFQGIIGQASKQTGVRAGLIAAIIEVESGGNPNASNKNSSALGLMQIERSAAEDMGVNYDDLRDPLTNVLCGAGYLARLIREFSGDEHAAVRAYFQGAGNEKKGMASPWYAEARTYETKVFSKDNGDGVIV